MAELHLPRTRNHFTDGRHHDDTSMTSDSSAMTRRRMTLGPADSSSERASSKLLVGFIWRYSLLPETVCNTSERPGSKLSVLYSAILCFQRQCVTRLKDRVVICRFYIALFSASRDSA